jgi:hypothetical protein
LLLKNLTIKQSLAVTFGCLPILVWLAFNYWRFNEVTFSPASKHALFHLATLLGEAKIDKSHPELLQKFALAFHQKRAKFSSNEISSFYRFKVEMDPNYSKNLDNAFLLQEELSLDWLTFHALLGDYAKIVIKQNFELYILHLLYSLISILDTILIITLLSLFAYKFRYYPVSSLISALTLAAAHLAITISIFLITPLNFRYYTLTMLPTLVAFSYVVCELIRASKIGSSSA